MIEVRKSADRGRTRTDWLDSRHTFSFGGYHDARHMGFRSLRVINEDRVQGGGGFPTHPHRDMEILTVVLSGGLEHRDSSGGGGVIETGDVQRMSAGKGVLHSEMNASPEEEVHFFQIWIVPDRPGLAPGYEQRAFPAGERRGTLLPLATPDARQGSLTLHQDAAVYGAVLEPGTPIRHPLAPGRHAWVQVAAGSVTVNGAPLAAGDGAGVGEEDDVVLAAEEPSEVLLFDLA